MVSIAPFKALRPDPAKASQICELPYDVMSSAEARQIAANNPLSFLRVSKPEIELPEGTDIYSAEVYTRGRDNFEKLIRSGALRQDPTPRYYFYRQVMGSHAQTGLVAAASCEDYLTNLIKKHEFTRPDKEDDRVRHIETLNAQTGPVFLVHRSAPDFSSFAASLILGTTPEIDFTAADGVRHTAWGVSKSEDIERITEAFRQMPALYIADGHHRCAAAGRVFKSRQGKGGSDRFLSVIFPQDQVRILPYNRVLKDTNGRSERELTAALTKVFTFREPGAAAPAQKGDLGFYMSGKWLTLQFKPELFAGANAFEALDVQLLQQHVLAPIFGIEDPRTSKRIQFVGGIRGTQELEAMVNSGEYACAFSMFPTGIDELMQIADAGGVMPPKSTWFEPKLRDAMFCHMLAL